MANVFPINAIFVIMISTVCVMMAHRILKLKNKVENDNRLMIYFQGMKVYIPDNFQPDTLLKLLQTLKKL